MSDLFYVFGVALAIAAVVVSFIGLRSEKFPGSNRGLLAVLGLFTLLVVGSCTFAVSLAREEKEHREHELEEERAAAEEVGTAEEEVDPENAGEPAEEAEPPQAPQQGPTEVAGAVLDLTSPADGSLVFEPETLTATPGPITIEYVNPAPVPHNVALEADGASLGESATVMGGETAEVEAELEPGNYVFYCAVPGHRESGMEGELTVE